VRGVGHPSVGMSLGTLKRLEQWVETCFLYTLLSCCRELYDRAHYCLRTNCRKLNFPHIVWFHLQFHSRGMPMQRGFGVNIQKSVLRWLLRFIPWFWHTVMLEQIINFTKALSRDEIMQVKSRKSTRTPLHSDAFCDWKQGSSYRTHFILQAVTQQLSLPLSRQVP
jgi:hypothetical protein